MLYRFLTGAMSKLITRQRIAAIVAGLSLIVMAVIVASILDTHAAVVSLKSPRMSQEQFQNDVGNEVEATTRMRVTRVGCGGITEIKWECFVNFEDQRERVVTVSRFQKSIAIDRIGPLRKVGDGGR
jgi:hypothetical protein